jgi:hypothetical protein
VQMADAAKTPVVFDASHHRSAGAIDLATISWRSVIDAGTPRWCLRCQSRPPSGGTPSARCSSPLCGKRRVRHRGDEPESGRAASCNDSRGSPANCSCPIRSTG